MDEARRTVEVAARTSYGRLVAMLASRGGDIAAAEDALGDALVSALTAWAQLGIPDQSDAWLLTAARRNLGHRRARDATIGAGMATLALLDAERAATGDQLFGDARLQLMFVCAHPAIERSVQSPLMLQTVLGLDAARIAGSYLVSPAAMSARLVRAKTKIRLARVPFAVPEVETLGVRTAAVLAAIYAAYGTGWDTLLAADVRGQGLTTEAIWLGRMVTELIPDEPEASGLLAMMLHCEARAAARRGVDGRFIPLREQDTKKWSRPMIGEAEALVRSAAGRGTPGRFQTEAAIQSLHAQSSMTGERLFEPLMRLYDLLIALTPTTGARVARAVAYAEGGRAQQAVALLDELELAGRSYQPWWVARARALSLLGQLDGARQAAVTAAGLTENAAIRAHLLSSELPGAMLHSANAGKDIACAPWRP